MGNSRGGRGRWGALWGNLLITVKTNLGRKISKTKHVWGTFMLLYEWEQFLIYNIPVIFRILIFCQFGILPTVKDWHLGFCPLLNIRAVRDYEKVIITIDFCSVESYEEKADFLRVTCTFSWASDCTLINFVLVFGINFPVIRKNEDIFGDFTPVSAIFVTEILKAFTGALLQQFTKQDPKATSCEACSKFKLFCSSWLSEGNICEIVELKYGRLRVLQIFPNTGIWQQ